MRVTCPDCGKFYDDARRWTICPHYDLDGPINGGLPTAGLNDLPVVDPADLLYTAWGIIANANGGNWDEARPDWKEAAERWREEYHAFLKIRPTSVMQTWTHGLTFMQQGVLVAAVRGPDGIKKDHVSKVLCRWLRRCFLVSAFEGSDFINPYAPGGGSFTGPCVWKDANGNPSIGAAVDEYFRHVDEIPHHFQLHLMHAAEILGYKYPKEDTRKWWHRLYLRMVNDMHLRPEPEEVMDHRLADDEQQWRAAEEVTAR